MNTKDMDAKKWNILVVTSVFAMLVCFAAVTAWVDPFLHYHECISFLEYPLKDERYENDGIARHYTYQGMITGTSMCQNFKTSQFEELWQVPAIKTAYSGATYHEICENIRRAVSYNPDLLYVVSSLDGNRLIYPAMKDEYTGYPDYLYDENPFNDVNYLLNKEVIPKTLAVFNYTRAGEQTPDMDDYGSWGSYMTYGREAVLSTFTLAEIAEEEVVLSPEDVAMVTENISQNYLNVALENPDVTFYLFYPPYSVCYWEALVRTKQLDAQLDAEELATGLLLSAENIHVYGFAERTDIIGNLDNYSDTLHYGEWINGEILSGIYQGEYELTKENYQAYYDTVRRLYHNYDYKY